MQQLRRLRTSIHTRRRVRANFRSADVVMVSFPKCGRTWLRLMVGRALGTHLGLQVTDPDVLTNLFRLTRHRDDVPTILVTHDDHPELKTARQVQRSKRRYRGKKVILLVRDPRDAMVSYYFQVTKRRNSFSGSIGDFIEQPVGGPESFVTFYNVWAAERSVPDGFLLVRYEDLHAEPTTQLRRVMDFIGVSVGDEVIGAAVESSTFDKMRALEREAAGGSKRLRPADPTDVTSYKTREGRVGGHHDHLSPTQIERLDAWVDRLSEVYGYRTAG